MNNQLIEKLKTVLVEYKEIQAKMQTPEILNDSQKIDLGLMSMGTLRCLINTTSKDFPTAEGNTTDLATEAVSALGAQNSGITITTASIKRESDIDSKEVYRYTEKRTHDAGFTSRENHFGYIGNCL